MNKLIEMNREIEGLQIELLGKILADIKRVESGIFRGLRTSYLESRKKEVKDLTTSLRNRQKDIEELYGKEFFKTLEEIKIK